MTLAQVETTFICQLNKPDNKKVLMDFAARKDSSCAELVRYYKWLISKLMATPAWECVALIRRLMN